MNVSHLHWKVIQWVVNRLEEVLFDARLRWRQLKPKVFGNLTRAKYEDENITFSGITVQGLKAVWKDELPREKATLSLKKLQWTTLLKHLAMLRRCYVKVRKHLMNNKYLN